MKIDYNDGSFEGIENDYIDYSGTSNEFDQGAIPKIEDQDLDWPNDSTTDVSRCIQCNTTFKNKAYLKHHIASVHDGVPVKSFDCTWEGCGKTFSWKNKLRDHIANVHERQKPYR